MEKDMIPALTESEQLARLLRHRRSQPAHQRAVDAEIDDRFLTTCAIVVIDMADFSRLTHFGGIIATLQQIQMMRDIAIPWIQQHRGTVLKAEADNLYATFDNVAAAFHTMQTLMLRLTAVKIGISVGIGYGEVLRVDGRELFGHEMNLASKLGEDLAQDNEILLTEAAYAALPMPFAPLVSMTQSISDITFTYYQLPAGAVGGPPV